MYYKEALDASRSVLGNTHPDTLTSISNIGMVLEVQGEINNTFLLIVLQIIIDIIKTTLSIKYTYDLYLLRSLSLIPFIVICISC